MGGYGFPQLGEEDPWEQILQGLYEQQQQSDAQQPWSEQIPGGGSSTQLPPQGMPRYQNPGPPVNTPSAEPPQMAPVPQMHGPYEPPQFNQEQGLMKNIGEGFRAAGMAAMPPEQLLQAQGLQAEYDKANMLAQIKQQEMQQAEYQHEQQLQLERDRLLERQRMDNGILSRIDPAKNTPGAITGDVKKDTYFQLLNTVNPDTGKKYTPMEAAPKLNEMFQKEGSTTEMDKFVDNQGKILHPDGAPMTPQEKKTAMIEYKRTGASNYMVPVQQERNQIFRERVDIARKGIELQIKKATGVTPSPDIIGRSQFAQQLQPHVQQLRQRIEEADKAGLLGPILGRGVEFMEGKIGSTGDPEKDRQYAQLRFDLSLMASGMNRVHFGKNAGEHTLQYFKDQVGGNFRSKEALLGSLDTAESYLGSYAAYNDNEGGAFASPFSVGGVAPTTATPKTKSASGKGGDSKGDWVYAKDPVSGRIKRAPKGEPIPPGWIPQ